ncbi:hypothetical protein [Yunchengibacter salinarum]|uniref:hypothetical protein n=1 Tax=Yunchengibacter salinarum TaxID=3133399 RepID=UPI0035B67332
MAQVNLELQMKFLNELDEALSEARARYRDESAEKRAELDYMKQEVTRAKRLVHDRLHRDGASTAQSDELPRLGGLALG